MQAVIVREHLPVLAPLSDMLTLALRHLRRLGRTPQLLLLGILSPVLFLLLFYYTFGGAIPIPGVSYINYMAPAFLLQNLIFGGFTTAVALAEDARSGLIERFRSLPMARSAVLTGRALGDLLNQALILAPTIGVALLLGFRFQTGVLPALAAIGLDLLFGFALFWVFAAIGLLTRNPQTAQASTPPFFVLIFLSSGYIPVNSLPTWLQGFARNQPLSQVTNALRCLTQGSSAEALLGHSTSYFVLMSLLWCAGLLLVFGGLALWAYRRLV